MGIIKYKMKDIIIVGASGLGREIADWIEDINEVEPTWNILGYLDDNLDALNGYPTDYKVIGTISEWEPRPSQWFVCGLAIPEVKRHCVGMLQSKGAQFATIIHPTAIISKFAEIGEGSVITQRSGVNTNAKVGKFVTLLESRMGHDSSIGDFSTLSGDCNINGHVSIGKDVYVSCGVSIAPSKKIGDNAKIGIGSVVISNVKAGITVFGNPSKKIEF